METLVRLRKDLGNQRRVEPGRVHTYSIQCAPDSRLSNILCHLRALAFDTHISTKLITGSKVAHILLACLLQLDGSINTFSPPKCDIHIILLRFSFVGVQQTACIKEPKQRRNKLVNHHQFTPSQVFNRIGCLLQAQFDVLIGARKVPNRDLLHVCARIGEMTAEYLPKTSPWSPASIR